MTAPSLLLTPLRGALLAEHDNTLDVLVRVQAPDAPEDAANVRPPLNLALVLDRSGSMRGRPLAEALRCAAFVIDHLTPADRASLVVYDHQVEVLVPPTAVTDPALFRRALEGVHCGGTTNLHGGWLSGAEGLASLERPEGLSRVILLSDGNANQGLTGVHEVTAQCAARAAAGVSTSTYGLGADFNEELMVSMARAGQGNSYYGQTADDLMDPFREELSLLTALCARKLTLDVKAADGVGVELLNDYDRLSPGRWRLPDLAYGAEAWALFRLTIPRAQVEALGRGGPLLTVSGRCEDRAGEAAEIDPRTLTLPALPSSAFGAVAEDPLVRRRAGELAAADLQKRARAAALRGDWHAVEATVELLREHGTHNNWIDGVARELRRLAERRDQQRFSKESHYSSSRMSRRLAPRVEDDELTGDSVPDYLRRKLMQGRRDPR